MKFKLCLLISLIPFLANASCPSSMYYPNGNTLKSGDSFYYSNGNTLKSGSSLYYSNGNTFKSSSSLYYSNGNTLKSGSSLYYKNGNTFKSGTSFYYPNGNTFKSGSSLYYPNGNTLKSGSSFYHPNGNTAKSGDTLFEQNGNSTQLPLILSSISTDIDLKYKLSHDSSAHRLYLNLAKSFLIESYGESQDFELQVLSDLPNNLLDFSVSGIESNFEIKINFQVSTNQFITLKVFENGSYQCDSDIDFPIGGKLDFETEVGRVQVDVSAGYDKTQIEKLIRDALKNL